MPHQKKAVKELGNGKILYGGTGTGKGYAVLGYYVEHESPRDIYVITTAKKRDTLDWHHEAASFGISTHVESSLHGTIKVDSWNNIGEYIDIKDAFFIFDEQRLVGSGAWVKSFQKIAKHNRWVLLSGTPGDTWMDYAPVFIANNFYKNMTDFKMKHVIYEPFTKFPKIRGYLNQTKLEMLRNDILVEMPFIRKTKRYINWTEVNYDKDLIKKIYTDRWNFYEDKPVKDAAEMGRLMRKVVNSDESRLLMIYQLMSSHDRMIVFYNFDYELDLLRTLSDEIDTFELNGHKKDPLPTGDRWVYLVQYIAGAEAWNCVTTNAMIFYSLTYSYKNFVQAQGRIDRLNTSYVDLFYYVLWSNSIPDRGVKGSLDKKEDFNERKYYKEMPRLGEFYDAF